MASEISKEKNRKIIVVILIVICVLVVGVGLSLFIGNLKSPVNGNLESPMMENKYMKVAKTEVEDEYDVNGNLSGRVEREYNCNDHPLAYKSYNLDNVLVDKQEFEYDNQGNKISKKVFSGCYDANGEFTGLYAEKKNDDGQLLSCESYNLDNELEFKEEYEYDDQGNKISCKSYNNQGKLESEKVFDKQGNELYEIDWIATEKYGILEAEEVDNSNVEVDVTIVTEVKYKSDGSVNQIIESTYDEKEQLLEKIEYDNEGNITSWIECTYNKKGNILERIEYDTNGQIFFMEEFTYDKDGNIIERIEYDGEGNIILHARLSKEIVTSYVGEEGIVYDANGNARKALVYDGKGSVIGRVESFGGCHWEEYINGELQNWYYKLYYDSNSYYSSEGRNGKYINDIKKLYDEQGKLTDVYVPIADLDGIIEWNGVLKWYFYNYDAQGRIASLGEREGLNGDPIRFWNYYYDDQDRIVKLEDEKQGAVVFFTYNDQGDLVSEKEYSKNQMLRSSKEYKYEKR